MVSDKSHHLFDFSEAVLSDAASVVLDFENAECITILANQGNGMAYSPSIASRLSTMDKESHRKDHELLHRALDRLLADYLQMTGKDLTGLTAIDLVQWSKKQSECPDHNPRNSHD
jgi:hypothetical protein